MDKPEEEQQLTDNNTADPLSCAYSNAAQKTILRLQRKLTE
jgi:hypothetical protein